MVRFWGSTFRDSAVVQTVITLVFISFEKLKPPSDMFILSLCGGLNKNGSHSSIGSVTTRRCGFVGVGMEEMSHWRWALKFQILNPGPASLSSF